MNRRLWISIGLVIAAIALIGGCSCSFSIGGDGLDRDELESNIAEGLGAGDAVEPDAVSCPEAEDVEVAADEEFSCTATKGKDVVANVAVTVVNEDGDVRYEVTGTMDLSVVERRIGQQLARQVGVAPSSVECPANNEVSVAEGQAFECVGTAPNGDEFTIDVELTDDRGTFDFEVPEQQFEDESA